MRVISAVLAVTTTTPAPPITHVTVYPTHHDWFDWTQYAGVQIAALMGIAGVILAGVLLLRSRPDCQLGPARFIRTSGDRWTLAIDLHIVAGGHWVLKGPPEVTFKANGRVLDAMRLDPTPMRGVGELQGQLVYEMEQPTTDTEIDASIKFRNKRKPTKFHGTVPPRI